MVGLAVLFLLLGGHQLLQNANDLAALWCVPLTGTARQERKQRGAIIIGNPCSWCFRAKRLRQQKSFRAGYLKRFIDPGTVYLRLFEFPTTFDIQSTTRKSHCHGYSRRLPALVVNHFDNLSVRFVFRHPNPSLTNDLHDLPQWLH